MNPKSLDHVALWVDERDVLARFLCAGCGMHEIERTDTFTLVGGDARRGKLTLFAVDGPRERGVLERVVLRVPDLEDCVARLSEQGAPATEHDGVVTVEAPAGLPLGLVEQEDSLVDIDHVLLRLPDPPASALAFEALGVDRDGESLRVADKRLVLREADVREGERPLLNHLAFLVDSALDVQQEAEERGFEIDRVVDAPNTLAVFVWGPDRIRIEYVEHKPSFSLV